MAASIMFRIRISSRGCAQGVLEKYSQYGSFFERPNIPFQGFTGPV